MSQSIDAVTRGRARTPGSHPASKPGRPLLNIWAFTAVATTTGVVLAATELTSDSHSLPGTAAAAICLAIGGITGCAALLIKSAIPSEQEFYRRGFIEGWLRGTHDRKQQMK